MPAQTLEWTKSLTKLKSINLMKNDQHFESMESPWANENPPGQPSFLKACWLLELFPFCSSIIMQYSFGSTDSSCAEVQGDALPRRADLQNRQALPWIEPCSGLNTFPFILPLRPSFICPLCPSCPFSKSFFFCNYKTQSQCLCWSGCCALCLYINVLYDCAGIKQKLWSRLAKQSKVNRPDVRVLLWRRHFITF